MLDFEYTLIYIIDERKMKNEIECSAIQRGNDAVAVRVGACRTVKLNRSIECICNKYGAVFITEVS